MTVEQRDVYLFPPTHDPSLENHPYIVLSVREANEFERIFIAVMVTSSVKYHDDFSFDLTNAMFEKPLEKEGSHARMHLMTLCLQEDVIGTKINRMKPFFFNQLMKSIGEVVFNYEFKPLEG